MNEVEVVHAQVGEIVDLDRFEETLTTDERKRARGYKLPDARDAFILARGLLRLELGRRTECRPGDLIFDLRPSGKPDLRAPGGDSAAWRFSVSHTGAHVAVAFTLGADVGLDIERLDRNVNPLAIASRYFTASEVKDLEARPLAQRSRAFLAGWTRKEAIVKARGTTMSESLNTLTVDLDPDQIHPLATDTPGRAVLPECRLTSFEIPGSLLIGAVALMSPTAPRLTFRVVKGPRFD